MEPHTEPHVSTSTVALQGLDTCLPEHMRGLRDALRRHDVVQLTRMYLRDLEIFRSDYSDDLPTYHLSYLAHDDPRYRQGRFKCRGNVVHGIGSSLRTAARWAPLGNVARAAVQAYSEYPFNCAAGRLTTASEIEFINKTLDIVIGELRGLLDSPDNKSSGPQAQAVNAQK